jgi:hypothetical protein
MFAFSLFQKPLILGSLQMDYIQVINLRLAYLVLERRVRRALSAQVGDSRRLCEVQGEVFSYSQAVEQVCGFCPLIKMY